MTDAFGLMYYNARWYDPTLGRFAQADTLIPGAGNPLAWDRYAYVNNNPVRHNDPSGHFLNIVVGAVVGAVVGVGTLAVNQALHPEVKYNSTDWVAAAGIGAAAGALISTGVGAGVGTALGASLIGGGVGMGASAAGYTLGAGTDYDSREMLVNAGAGCLTGMASGGIGSAMSGPGAILGRGMLYGTLNMAQTVGVNKFLGETTSSSDLSISFQLGFAGGAASGIFDVLGNYGNAFNFPPKAATGLDAWRSQVMADPTLGQSVVLGLSKGFIAYDTATDVGLTFYDAYLSTTIRFTHGDN